MIATAPKLKATFKIESTSFPQLLVYMQKKIDYSTKANIFHRFATGHP
jgi:hypothetical protein